MRIAHARFGFAYNRIHGRTGKVANERPQTPLIEDKSHNLRVHLYIEANPLRANLMSLSELKLYPYSSYGYYAYGIKSKWSHLLAEPDWYIELGSSPAMRQAKYRKIFANYIKDELIPTKLSKKFFFKNYIGCESWVEKMTNLTKVVLSTRESSSARGVYSEVTPKNTT